jgi:hypothetical protein
VRFPSQSRNHQRLAPSNLQHPTCCTFPEEARSYRSRRDCDCDCVSYTGHHTCGTYLKTHDRLARMMDDGQITSDSCVECRGVAAVIVAGFQDICVEFISLQRQQKTIVTLIRFQILLQYLLLQLSCSGRLKQRPIWVDLESTNSRKASIFT